MEFALDYNSLSERYFKIRNELDESFIYLKKLSNRGNFVPSGCKRQFFMPLERNVPPEESSVKQDKYSDSSESEESASDNDDPSKKGALQSAVIASVGSSKTRRKFICTYNSDNKVKLRNRRFFGMVQNTLLKFQDEEVRRQPQDLKRKKAIEKVDAAVEDEKNSVKRQKEDLLFKSRKQQLELECLKKMMKIAESFELWKNNQTYLLNHIATITEPQIFFLPTSLSSTTKKHLERSRMEIVGKIERQKTYVEAVLSRIRQSYSFSVPVSTDETLLISKVDNFQNVLKPEITDKDTEEILHLDLSENESEDFY